jgi:hypothetical protein
LGDLEIETSKLNITDSNIDLLINEIEFNNFAKNINKVFKKSLEFLKESDDNNISILTNF